MLENQALWLSPWSVSGSSARRDILDPDTHRYLGSARRQLPTGWRRLLSGSTIQVFETEDESLLFSMERYWGWGTVWLVYDADHRRVGSVRGPRIRDPFGHQVAMLQRCPDGSAGRWLSPAGQELGSMTTTPERTLVTFPSDRDCDPFTRMALLATVLVDG